MSDQTPSSLAYRLEFERLYQVPDGRFHEMLRRTIQLFAMEAVKPWQDAFTASLMRSSGPLRVSLGVESTDSIELWRGQSCGDWYRIVSCGYGRWIQLERNNGLPEDERWCVEWMG